MQIQPQPQHLTSWALKSSILFRTGELVWYQNGNTWRLGIIAASGTGSYEVMPISHGMIQAPNVTKTDADMRPFHAFTVPPVAIVDLREKVYDGVPWDAMFRALDDAAKRDQLALDASKMAALKIDWSYSLFSPLSDGTTTTTNGIKDVVSYFGAFLGAERVEMGDCLRIRTPIPELDLNTPDTAVLALRCIFTTSEYPGAIFFRGSIYQLLNGGEDADSAAAVPDAQLPPALREDSQWRASVNPSSQPQQRWTLARENVALKEKQIRGRVYPNSRLMPILDPNGFRTAVAQGNTSQLQAHLNNRMEGKGRYIGHKRNRLDALGASVPHTARLVLEPHVREEPTNDVIVPKTEA